MNRPLGDRDGLLEILRNYSEINKTILRQPTIKKTALHKNTLQHAARAGELVLLRVLLRENC